MMLIREEAQTTPCVVVVEDDPTIAWLIAATLSDEGYKSVVVHNGRAALEAIEDLHPAAITLDLQLPDLDGRAVLRRLKTIEPTARPRVVVVSSDADWLTRDERRGVAGTLKKPFDLSDLVRAVRGVTDRRAS
jgi:two-component system KDP operon response regulator KdpE